MATRKSATPKTPSSVARARASGKKSTRNSAPAARSAETPYVVLLRGVNVGGNKLVPMQRLRALAEKLGCTGVATYIQSGNVVLKSALAEPRLESALEAALESAFGFAVPVIVRSLAEWKRYAAGSPFPDAE